MSVAIKRNRDRTDVPARKKSYSVPQIMAILGVSRHTIYRLIERGKLPAIHLGKGYRVFPDDLDVFIAEQKESLRHWKQGLPKFR